MRLPPIFLSTFLIVSLTVGACSSGKEQADAITDADTAVPTATPPATTANQTAPTSTPAPTATTAPSAIKLLESGFTSYPDSGGNIIGSWAAVLQNVDTGHQATDTQDHRALLQRR